MSSGKILLITNNFPPIRGGSATVYANLARCASQQIIVMAPSVDYNDGLPVIGWREHDRHVPYRVIRLPLLRTMMGQAGGQAGGQVARRGRKKALRYLSDVAIRIRLATALLKVVLVNGVRTVCIGELVTSSWIINFIRFLPRVTSVSYVHGEEITTRNSYDSDHHRARKALLHSDLLITVSQFTFAAVENLMGGRARGRVHLIHNGVDTGRFRPRAKSSGLLKMYGLDNCFVFVSMSRLVEKKGTDNTIRALTRVVAVHPECRLLIVGAGPYRSRLEDIVRVEGLGKQVVFAGSVAENEMVEHYQLGDVFVMPNRRMPDGDTEGFGLVFLEANACGLPAIAGQDGGSPEAVHDGVNGLVIDGQKIGQIATAMLTMREDPALYERLQRQGLKVATEADWRLKAKRFLEVCGVR